MIGFLIASIVLNVFLLLALRNESKRVRLYMEDRLWWIAKCEEANLENAKLFKERYE